MAVIFGEFFLVSVFNEKKARKLLNKLAENMEQTSGQIRDKNSKVRETFVLHATLLT